MRPARDARTRRTSTIAEGVPFPAWIGQDSRGAHLGDFADRGNGFDGTPGRAADINDAGVVTGRVIAADGSRSAFIATPMPH